MGNRIPTAESLAETTAALRAFLAKYNTYRPILPDPSIGAGVMAAAVVLPSFARLERCLNPRRIPFGQRLHAGSSMAHWPESVMVALSALDGVIGALIKRWDVPEFCEDKGTLRGRGDIRQPDAEGRETEIHFDRPFQPLSLTPEEEERLHWCLEQLEAALIAIARTPEVVEPAEPMPESDGPTPADLVPLLDAILRPVRPCLSMHLSQGEMPLTVSGARELTENFRALRGTLRTLLGTGDATAPGVKEAQDLCDAIDPYALNQPTRLLDGESLKRFVPELGRVRDLIDLSRLPGATSEPPADEHPQGEVKPGSNQKCVDRSKIKKVRINREEAAVRVRDFLNENPGATIEQVHKGTGVSTGAICKTLAWRQQMRSREISAREGQQPKQRPLTKKMCHVIQANSPDSAEILDDLEITKNVFLNNATPAQKRKFYQLPLDAQQNFLFLYGQGEYEESDLDA
jgi:hypothetical protein